jgi:hypothetical protein
VSNKTSGPAIDPSDMANNQSGMLGVHTFNVQSQYNDDVNHVKIPPPDVNAVDTSVNASFVKDAPNLPLRLFGLEHLFGGKS